MFRWLKRRDEVLRARDVQWLTAELAGPDGWSDFQRRADEALAKAGFPLSGRGLRFSNRSPGELFVTGTVAPSNSRVNLYADAAEIRSNNRGVVFFEECDTS